MELLDKAVANKIHKRMQLANRVSLWATLKSMKVIDDDKEDEMQVRFLLVRTGWLPRF